MKWLTPAGALAALAVGAAVTMGFGWRGLVVLFTFFVTASALTRRTGADARGRSARQVIANGGVAAIAAAVGWWAGLAGALAAATADTWATEIGSRAKGQPRMITTGARVQPGTSGGITFLGTAAGALGAALIAAVAAGLGALPATWAAGVAVAGVGGMVVDSLLGAVLQGRFRCGECGAEYERRDVACHGPLTLARGIAWLDNDAVNLAATVTGAVAAVWLTRV